VAVFAAVISGDADARTQCQRSVDLADHVGECDFLRRTSEQIAALPAAHAALNTANMRAALIAALDKPGRVHANLGDCDGAFAHAAWIVEATYSTPYLPRARMEPGNATVLYWCSVFDAAIGRFDTAIATALRAVALDPLNPGGEAPTASI